MNALIVDDEKQARETLLQIINLCCPSITDCRQADSLSAAITAIEEEHPDILFLDIDLGADSGFEILKHFHKEPLNVVFVTGHNNYVLQALRASAVDFLLKPVKSSEIIAAVQKVEQKHAQQHYYKRIDTLLSNLSTPKESIQKLTINTANSLYIVDVDDIIYCESDKGYTTFYTVSQQKIIASKIIREYEDILPKKNFMRVHQSFLVNLDHVLRYDKKDKNSLVTILDHRIPVSHRLKAKVIDYFDALGKRS